MSPEIIALHDNFTRGRLDRREFFAKLTRIAGGTAAASALLPLLENNYALAQMVAKDDPRLIAESITYPVETGRHESLPGQDQGDGKRPAVVVIHENRGLTPHRRRRPSGGAGRLSGHRSRRPVPSRRDAGRSGRRHAAPSEARPDGQHQEFCRRGRLPENASALDRKSRLHGLLLGRRCDQPGRGQLAGPRGRGPLLWPPAGGRGRPQDQGRTPSFITPVRTNGSTPASRPTKKPSKKRASEYKLYMYEGAGHAFFNDSNAARYNKEAAILAWQRTLGLLQGQAEDLVRAFCSFGPESGANRTSRLPGPQTSLPRPARSDSDASTPRPRPRRMAGNG